MILSYHLDLGNYLFKLKIKAMLVGEFVCNTGMGPSHTTYIILLKIHVL